MKVGFVSEHYPPTEGGVATSTQRVARELVKLGVEVHVICFDHSRSIESKDYVVNDNDEGVVLHKIGPFFLKQSSLSVDNIPEKVKAAFRRRAFEQIIKIFRKEQVELVLSFYLLNAGYLAQFAARELGIPHIAGVRGNDIGRNIFNVERFAVIQWIVHNSNELVCVNNHLRQRLLLAFPDAEGRTSIIPNSTVNSVLQKSTIDNVVNRQKVKLATGWTDECLRIVFIGTLREKKGVVTLLESISLLRRRITVHLLVVGPEIGSIEKKLCGSLWAQLKDEGILFVTGKIPRSEVAGWALGCDVVVMPSLDDGMANGLLEGMNLGLCPVATEVFTDVISNGGNGLIVPIGDTEALANAIYSLTVDRNKLVELGRQAKTSVKKWTPQSEASAYYELFTKLLPTRLKGKEMIPLSKPFVPIKAEQAINECLKSGWIGYGPVCNSLEGRFISKHGGWALATTSCTSALHIAAQLIRISEADEVIIPAMTFISTAMAFHAAGFKVQLADVDPATLLLTKSGVEKLINDKTRAIVTVHLYGQRAPVEAIRELCDSYELIMIEDCAHRLSLLDDFPLLADFACYSFNAVKEAPCGEGGLLWARDLESEKHARELSNLGLNIDTFQRASNLNHSEVFFGKEIGLKLRLNDVLASMVNTSIDTLSETRKRRSAVFEYYDSKIDLMAPYVIPFKRRDDDSFLMYVVRLENLDRERLREDMARMGIATSVHYISLSEHPFFNPADCPVSYINSRKLLSLPCFPEMLEEDQDKVICCLVKVLENQKKERIFGKLIFT